ncbi:DUF3427 domain-containing protein [Ningiella sp. W23]|uniref:DUF3427 domain-containing protein n=1 Tax=Ningiella sp. W23 TaxID=3023715 RepID=UPI003756A3D9
MFIALHKDEDDIAYKDKFISRTRMQWDSPNSSRPDKGLGREIIEHQKNGYVLHLFVRKFKEIDGVVQPYIYIGGANYKSHSYRAQSEPITFQLRLEQQVPPNIYAEFTSEA